MKLVVLHHTGVAEPHFDFMFERRAGEMLRTFRIGVWPMEFGRDQTATELPDHRHDYLTYEGPVSGDRGEVKRVAAGTATVSEEQDEIQCTLQVETPSMELLTLELRRRSGTIWTIRRIA